MIAMYDRYYNLINKIARTRDFIKRHIIAFSAAVVVLTIAILAFIYNCGRFTQSITCTDSIYGEEISYSAKAFFSKVSYEFSEKGSNSWSDSCPIMPG